MSKEDFRKINPEPKEPLKKIKSEKDIKINPELLEPLMRALDRVKDEKRIDYINNLISDIELTIEKAHQLQAIRKIDFETALDQVIPKKKRYNP